MKTVKAVLGMFVLVLLVTGIARSEQNHEAVFLNVRGTSKTLVSEELRPVCGTTTTIETADTVWVWYGWTWDGDRDPLKTSQLYWTEQGESFRCYSQISPRESTGLWVEYKKIPHEIDWLGYVTFSRESPIDSHYTVTEWRRGIEIGLRKDGTVVWRKVDGRRK